MSISVAPEAIASRAAAGPSRLSPPRARARSSSIGVRGMCPRFTPGGPFVPDPRSSRRWQTLSVPPDPSPSLAINHWNRVYETKQPHEVSWYQPGPGRSLALIEALALAHDAAIVDVGGGTSGLARQLLELGFTDVTVLDISAPALELARADLGRDATRVRWLEQDLLSWSPDRRYDLWHDRAVFHFLVAARDRQHYADLLHSALRPGGKAIVGTFAADGPTSCSGLPVARYNPDMLAAALGGAFTTLATSREEHHTPGGSTQPFTWVTLERAQ